MQKYNNSDWVAVEERFDEFWKMENSDRPIIQIFARTEEFHKAPSYKDLDERWWNPEYFAKMQQHQYNNQKCLGEAFQLAWVNTGPVFGCSMLEAEPIFDKRTSWFEPSIPSASELPEISYDFSKGPFGKLMNLYKGLELLDSDKFLPAHFDMGGPSDILMTLLGTQKFLEDTLLDKDAIIKAVQLIAEEFNKCFLQIDKNVAKDQIFSDWINLLYPKKGYVVGEDCLVMLDPDSVNDIVVPGVRTIIKDIPYPVFHFHSAGAHNLDKILSIDELRGIEWSDDPKDARPHERIDTFKKILGSGKTLMVYPKNDEIELLCKNLPAEGVLISINVESAEEGEDCLRRIESFY